MKMLISGGTGSLGKELIRRLHTTVDRLVCFSRDEFKQSELEKIYPEGGEKGLRYFIGDIKDLDRLTLAMSSIEVVVHAAAYKRIETCSYNPTEALQTNIIGTWNVIKAAATAGVKKVIFISTDKAPAASTMYGASKLVSEFLMISANNLSKTRYSVVRYGNVLGSRGSVFDLWKKQASEGKPLTITDKRMTRFFWSIEEAADFVLRRLGDMQGGEIFLPKMKGFSIEAMAKGISNNIIETGIRGIEKLHEILLTEEEARHCYYCEDYYTIMPEEHSWSKTMLSKGIKVPDDFKLMSCTGMFSDIVLKNEGKEE